MFMRAFMAGAEGVEPSPRGFGEIYRMFYAVLFHIKAYYPIPAKSLISSGFSALLIEVAASLLTTANFSNFRSFLEKF